MKLLKRLAKNKIQTIIKQIENKPVMTFNEFINLMQPLKNEYYIEYLTDINNYLQVFGREYFYELENRTYYITRNFIADNISEKETYKKIHKIVNNFLNGIKKHMSSSKRIRDIDNFVCQELLYINSLKPYSTITKK